MCFELKVRCPPTRDFFAEPISKLFYNPIRNNDVRWNFEKYLINRQGLPVKRYDPGTKPSDILPDILDLINETK